MPEAVAPLSTMQGGATQLGKIVPPEAVSTEPGPRDTQASVRG